MYVYIYIYMYLYVYMSILYIYIYNIYALSACRNETALVAPVALVSSGYNSSTLLQ